VLANLKYLVLLNPAVAGTFVIFLRSLILGLALPLRKLNVLWCSYFEHGAVLSLRDEELDTVCVPLLAEQHEFKQQRFPDLSHCLSHVDLALKAVGSISPVSDQVGQSIQFLESAHKYSIYFADASHVDLLQVHPNRELGCEKDLFINLSHQLVLCNNRVVNLCLLGGLINVESIARQ